jgi:2'-5' RNA ligase
MQANWFIALRVLEGAFLTALEPPAQVRLFAPEDLHITLAFLGKVDEARARASFALAQSFFSSRTDPRASTPLAPLSTELGDVVALGARRRPSAFSALPTRYRREIEAVMTATRDVLCDAAGCARETRPALAHVTLARPSRRASAHEIELARLWATGLDLQSPTIRIESVALYTWSSDRARTLFQIVAEDPLL